MSEESFQQYYEHLTDDQLSQVVDDRKDLVPEAIAALDREVSRRHLKPPQPPIWTRQQDSDDSANSLEEFDRYRWLMRQKRFVERFWYLFALAPFVIVSLTQKNAFQDPENIKTCVGFCILFAFYWLRLIFKYVTFVCPQCSERFSSGATCVNCGFPRSSRP